MSDPVVIVGGGAIGSAAAYFLASDPAFDGRVIVIERDPSYARASSALSASSIRQQFSTPDHIALSRFGIEFLRDIGARLAVDGAPPPDVGLVEPGYLFLVSPAGLPVLEANHRTQRAHGADVRAADPGRARRALSLARHRGAGRRVARPCRAKAGSTATR